MTRRLPVVVSLPRTAITIAALLLALAGSIAGGWHHHDLPTHDVSIREARTFERISECRVCSLTQTAAPDDAHSSPLLIPDVPLFALSLCDHICLDEAERWSSIPRGPPAA